MPSITPNVSFDHVAREWRCKWSSDHDSASLSACQDALTSLALPALKAAYPNAEVTRTVCGGCHDFKVAVRLPAAEFGKFEADGFGPEGAFLDKLKFIEGVSMVETQTFTLEKL
mmetsp:Transcript_19922/g.49467  ORF Transcript_19922/g.49467 Transcript_19922/m.49467 type:complete len:114 (+) Transcript_19922:186-527(+)|eukprot:CAMPEP_0174912010 /NCGR_PEP_ID=MMETSP0167-20121228/79182_1 /TAXON_ID=38298 /ORGANISM="Rhodella maculata, Strain CCMP736" /LENGTH=113 /DNA_ID=CAMNT_0016156635 /DNA_START=110 /DNA_END=451 /DNA_ORIENTATION=-